MAINRYALEKYATIELNHVSFPETGRVFAQLPLSATEFSKDAPCENGMWLVYDLAAGTAHKAAAVTDPVGIVYNAEKEYNPYISGMNQYALAPGGYCPRIGMPLVGDTYTTNCFCYDTSVFANDAAVDTALEAVGTTPLYLVPMAGQGAPALVKSVGTAATIAKVVKVYTMPNGELGLKVQFTKVA